MANGTGMVDPRIFEDLQTKIDEDADVREQIKAILLTLERQGRIAQSILSRAHSTPAAHREKHLHLPRVRLTHHSPACSRLRRISHQRGGRDSRQAFYCSFELPILQVRITITSWKLANWNRYNGLWTREIQNVIFAILLCGWLGGMGKGPEPGKLLTIEEVGEILNGDSEIPRLQNLH